MTSPDLLVRSFGLRDYESVWQEMKLLTSDRTSASTDELWLVEHPPVFTLGQAGKAVHILKDVGVPIVNSDRGGQVTYHGPGQLVIYLLIDIKRKGIGVRDLVTGIEEAIARLLKHYHIESAPRREAPGVYVSGKKIAALGLRVRKGRTYHGLSLNVAMDLSPFGAINPCGYQGLEVTSLEQLGVEVTMPEVAKALVDEIVNGFKYDKPRWQDSLPD